MSETTSTTKRHKSTMHDGERRCEAYGLHKTQTADLLEKPPALPAEVSQIAAVQSNALRLVTHLCVCEGVSKRPGGDVHSDIDKQTHAEIATRCRAKKLRPQTQTQHTETKKSKLTSTSASATKRKFQMPDCSTSYVSTSARKLPGYDCA